MTRLVLAFVVLLPSIAANQDVAHVPTAAQCQAQQRLWHGEIEESVQDHSAHLPGIHGIREWKQEMSDCEKVDPENLLQYHNIESQLTAEEKMRMEDFLHHHQLWDKFITADADGER
jgi:hypothetical protein